MELQSNNLDRLPSDDEVRYSPDNGDQSATNPPAFIWLPVEEADEYIVQYSRSEAFDPNETVMVREIDMSVYIPAEIMDPGVWYWRYGYNDGNSDRFSQIRSFEIPDDAVEFPLISADEFIAKIPDHRPRLYFSPDMVTKIRSDADGRYAEFTEPVILEAEEILALNEPLFEEPEDWEVYRETEQWIPEERANYLHMFRTMRPYTRRMVTSAMAYIYTGDERYAEEAKRRLMHFMSWDVEGASSTIFPTELGMDIAENATPVFDWIYPVLSEEERRICKNVLTARMVQINRDVHRARPMEAQPYSSHPGRMVGFAIEGGIVLAHEAPEARDWLDYTLRLLWSTYPAWGGADGGWHEGVSYWTGYMRRMVRVVHELNYYGIPLRDKPFFQNTGWFGLYAGYPGRPTRAFGDGYSRLLGSEPGVVTYLASNLYDNPLFRWHSEQIGSGASGRKAIRMYNPDLKALAPADIPQSRVFYDVGLVAMHSKMADPENNIMMLFQSNPYGGISHNHANQNAFVIEAFKEPLIISTGARQNHGSEHHREWMWHTKAHNSILVDFEGQVTRSRSAGGRIIRYNEFDDYMYTTGDATDAYGGRLKRFHRHILHLRPDYFVIIDDLETTGDLSTFQWLLHSPTGFSIDRSNNLVVNKYGNARLTTRFLVPNSLEFHQHTGFEAQVVDSTRMRNQFHLTASTNEASRLQHFVTVIRVDRTDGLPVTLPEPPSTPRREIQIRNIGNSDVPDTFLDQVSLLEAEGGIALRVGDDLILWKAEDARHVRASGTSTSETLKVRKDFFNESGLE